MKKRYDCLKQIFPVLIGFIVALGGTGTHALIQDTEAIKVSYEYANWSLPFLVALDNGYFEKQGLKVIPENVEGRQTLDFRSFDIINGHGFYMLKKEEINPDIVKFCHPFAMTKKGEMIKGLLVKKAARIATWADFKQKAIIINSFDDMDLLKTVLEKNGLTVFGDKADISGFRAGGGAVRDFSEETGGDALYTWATDIKKFMDEKPEAYALFAKNLECEYISDPYFVACSYVNMESFRQNPSAIQKYILAIDQAIDFIRLYPKESLATVPKYFSSWNPEGAVRLGIYHFFKSTEPINFIALEKSTGKDYKAFVL